MHGVATLVAGYASQARRPVPPRPPAVTAPSFDDAPHPALGLVRAQLVIVYAFSALNKLAHGFFRGDSLAILMQTSGHSLAPWGGALSWAVILAELAQFAESARARRSTPTCP